MTTKKKPPSKSPRRITGSARPLTSKKTQLKIPAHSGALWDDDRAFRILVKNSSEIFTFLDSNGKILYRSPSTGRVISSPDKTVVQSNFLEWILPEDQAEAQITLARILKSFGKTLPFQTRIRDEDGTAHWVEGFATNYLNNPAICAILVNYHDVTDRKQKEQALLENERRYRELFENAVLAIFQSSFDGKVLRVNTAFARLFGYASPADVTASVHSVSSDIFADPARRETIIRERAENPRLSTFENLYRRKDGSTFWGLLNVRTIADDAGRPLFFEGFIEDINERKRTEQALRESEETFRSIFNNSSAGVALVGLDRRYQMVNPAYCEIFGYTEEEFRKVDFLELTHPEDAENSRQLMRDVLNGKGRNIRFAKRYLHKDGHTVWAEVSSALVFDPEGKPSHFITHILDITDRRRAEESLRESEEKFAKLFQDAPVPIIITDSASGTVLDVNEEALRVFGYRRDEILGKKLLDIGVITPEDRARIVDDTKSRGRITGIEMNFRAKDGRLIVGILRAERIYISGRDNILAAMVDITERKRVEEEFHALAARHEALLEAIPEIVMEVDDHKIYTWSNPAGIEFFGEDVIGKEAAAYFEGEQNIYTDVQPLFNGNEGTIYVESWQRRKDGQKRLLAWWCRNLKNNRGEVIGALSSARDITEKRLADEQIQILSRFPTENPNPVMRITPDGMLLFANNASRPFLDMWKVEVGQTVPEEYRALIGDVYVSNAIREIEVPCGNRVFSCSLSPIQKAGYVNMYGRDITERMQAEEALSRQAEELRQRNADLARLNALTERRMQRLIAMRAIDTAITSSFKLELVLNILLGQLTDLLGVHAADILIFLPDLQTFRFACGRGFRNTIPEQAFVRKAGSYANQATQERRTIKVARLDERTDAARIYPKTAGEDFSAYLCLPLMAKGVVKGVLEIFHRAAIDLAPEEESFLDMVAGQAAIAIDNAEMFEGLQASNDELTLAYTDTLTGWARTLELRNRETAGEAQRLAEITVRLGRSLGANENEMVFMYRGAILHDIGMMGIPDSILLKPGPLTEEERAVVWKHPQYAYDLLSSINYLRSAIDIPFGHHERWDGSGYPRGLKGDQIPLAARIFAVVDVWDALRSRRAYRAAWTDAETREYIRQNSGTLFDPKAAQVFLEVISGL